MSAAVGIDVGGTKIAAGVVDTATGAIRERREIPTLAERGGDAVLADVVELAGALAAPGTPIGIGVPEIVDGRGRIRSTANWDWRDVDLGTAFAGVGTPRIASDVAAAALAEARLGAGGGEASFLYVSVGTGISTTLVLDGHPWPGADGRAIILGAPMVEGVAGGPAIARAAGTPSAHEALADPAHRGVVEAAAGALGLELARVVHATDPGLVVIGGGLGLNDDYRALTAAALRAALDPDCAIAPRIEPARLGADAGLIGAALFAAPTP